MVLYKTYYTPSAAARGRKDTEQQKTAKPWHNSRCCPTQPSADAHGLCNELHRSHEVALEGIS